MFRFALNFRNMRIILFTIFISFLSCRSIDRFQTSSYNSLAPNHKKIAVLPINLTGKVITTEMSEEEVNSRLKHESDEIQNTLYNFIAKSSGRDKREIKIILKSIHSTNRLLEENNINFNNIADVSELQLREILEVDAVLRTTINTNVFLTDRSEDLAKTVVKTASILLDNDILDRATRTEMTSALVRSELVDLYEEVPIWIYDKEREIRLTDHNSEILNKLCGDVCKNFPYREENRRI